MNSFFRFLQSNLLLVVAVGASVLLLIAGLVLIYTAPGPAPDNKAASSNDLPYDVPPLPDVDNNPPADLSSIQAALNEMSVGVMPTGQTFSPEVIAEALETVEVGSETWCDILLLKLETDWTEAEAQQFAQHCI